MMPIIPACLLTLDLSRPKIPPTKVAPPEVDAQEVDAQGADAQELATQHRILVTNPATLYGFSN